MLCKYTSAVLFTLSPFYLPFTSISGEFIVYIVQYSYVFQNSYYCSFGHMVLECRIAFGDIHFLGKLIRFMHFYRHYNFNLLFSFILSTKFFVSPRILTIFNLSVHCFHIVTKISLSLIRSRGVRMLDFLWE